ncbi:uncharacterized protein PFLUO_LOCUS7283 [Penicillium psychrofluorescens]|uniref:uncharacterized protein n=1 Tax=Penicillium psychrofluorescens TaxID=3158075 RepID=UPI003CCD12E7
MPLRVIVVGAGIAGLCAAVALRQHGHSVTIFEKSKFATEVGAAIALSPNGVLVLQGLGFSFQNARAQSQDVWESLDGRTLERLAYTEVTDAQERFGAPFLAIHRVDLHTELLRLALDDDQERGSCSPPAALHLNCRIVAVQPEQGTVQLEDGSLHHADLVVAADGLRSVIRPAVVSREKEGEAMPIPSGMSAFRFLVPTASLKHDAVYERAKKWKYARGVTVMADTQDPDFKDRHIVWYACQE